MALLTSYTAANRIVLSGKTRRITCGAPSAPIVSAAKSEDGTISATAEAWYEMICHYTASFAFVGMDLATAKKCRDDMIAKFTRTKSVWEFKTTVNKEDGTVTIGWVKSSTGATVQEAEVNLTHAGGHMYEVTVQVDCEDVVMTTSPSSTSFSWPACMADVD